MRLSHIFDRKFCYFRKKLSKQGVKYRKKEKNEKQVNGNFIYFCLRKGVECVIIML